MKPLGFADHDHKTCIATALDAADARCAERGVQLTPARRRSWEILLEEHRALGAYDILERLREGGQRAQPPAAYRALDFLVAQGLAHKIERLSAFVACAHPEAAHLPAFLICKSCDHVAEAQADVAPGSLRSMADAAGFEIETTVLEATGTCPNCQEAPALSAADLVTLTGVGARYGRKTVLRDVDLSVAPGEIVTVVGPNGSGKSTLIAADRGAAVAPETGKIARAPGLRIGYVPQRLHIDTTLPITVRRFLDLPHRASEADAHAALAQAGAQGLERQQMTALSGGQFQRVLLARALLSKPHLLILDEATQGLDQPGSAAFYRLIEQVRGALDCAVLMVSHELHVVMAASDRVICLNGHVCCAGAPEHVAQAEEYRALFGSGTGGALALYRHEHDHSHGAAGAACDHDHDHPHETAAE